MVADRRPPLPVYPLLLGLYPVLALYAHNSDQLTPDSLVLPSAVALGLSVAVLLVMRWLCGDWRRAGIPAGLFVVLFFAYGHIHAPIREYWPDRIVLSSILLMILALAVVVAAALLIRGRPRARLLTVTVAFNTVSLFVLIVPLVRIAAYEAQAPRQPLARPVKQEATRDTSGYPNILYLVPDRYPSESTLVEVYDHDNSEFLDALRARGFHVADESRCNYGRTDMSLASVLNMEYLDSLIGEVEPHNTRRVLYRMIEDNEVLAFLQARRYRYLHLGTSWQGTNRNRHADANYSHVLLPEFAMMLYRTTMAHPVGVAFGCDVYRRQWARVRYKFDLLESLDSMPGPVFVFAHFLVPHEPYVLTRDGEFVDRRERLARGVPAGFVEQVMYVNRRILTLVDRLTDEGNPRPWAILVQSDEGPHPPHNFEHRDSLQTLRAKFRILNAFYLPGTDASVLHPEISSVNTFRFLFDSYFGTEYGLLPDRSLLVQNGEQVDITELVRYQQADRQFNFP